ncbi:MAG: EamA family transporter [Deltaproteobacteria bacterium]|nr:EamA family transporter [Deltaproteobacteria bacterium]
MKHNNQFSTYLILTGAMLFWGLSFVATKIALQSIPTFTLIFLRFSIAACLLLPWLIHRDRLSFTRKDHFKLFLVALFEPGLYFIFETIGLQHTSAPKAALIIATIPVVVLFAASLLLGERISPAKLFGTLISIGGISVLVAGDPQFEWDLGGPLLGDLLIFGAVISASLYIVCARDLGKNYSTIEITGMQVVYGALFYAPAFIWELPEIQWAAISTNSIGALVYLTLFATIAAFLCYNHALTQIPAFRAAIFINGIPLVTAAGAWVLLGEKLTLIQAGGGLLVLCAVYLTNRPELQTVPQEF